MGEKKDLLGLKSTQIEVIHLEVKFCVKFPLEITNNFVVKRPKLADSLDDELPAVFDFSARIPLHGQQA